MRTVTTALHCIAMMFVYARRIFGNGARATGIASATASALFTEAKPCDDKPGSNAYNQQDDEIFQHESSSMSKSFSFCRYASLRACTVLKAIAKTSCDLPGIFLLVAGPLPGFLVHAVDDITKFHTGFEVFIELVGAV